MAKQYQKMRVVILTSSYQIHGDITLEKGTRLTDHVDKSPAFLALTDAEVTSREGNSVLAAGFLDVNRQSIEIVVPDEPKNLIRSRRDAAHLISSSGPPPIDSVDGVESEELTFNQKDLPSSHDV